VRKPPALTDFYERKRRLAYVFAALSALLLFANLTLGFSLETYDRPGVAVEDETVWTVFRSRVLDADGEPTSRLVRFDAALRGDRRRIELGGEAGALLAEGDEVTAFLGSRYAVLRDGNSLRGADLRQAWEVRAAVRDAARATAWIFGWKDGRIVARRRGLGAWSGEIEVAPAGAPDRLAASLDPAHGPFVAWREKGAARVRSVRWDGRTFAPRADFEGVDADQWDAIPWKDRVLLVTYRKAERTWRQVTLGLDCCAGCPGDRLSRKAALADPVLVLGRKVTGLAAAWAGETLIVALTRWTTVQAAALDPLSGGGGLVPVDAVPFWRRLAAGATPLLLLFFSFSMIFLGFTLFRERDKKPAIELLSPRIAQKPPPAEVLQRAMAYILDHIVMLPLFFVAVEFLNVSPELSAPDLKDPRFLGMVGAWLALHFVYHTAFEGALGWTPGKKILGLRVTDLDCERAGWGAVLVRNLIRPFDAEYPLGVFIGALAMMLSPRRQRLGDRWARTLVVEESGFPAPSAGAGRIESR
jgi:uncharacterized RDD family membrane protein YckC